MLLFWVAASTAAPVAATDAAATVAQKIEASTVSPDQGLPDGVDRGTGFRMKRYRAPVPAFNPGTETVDTRRAQLLHKTGAVIFIDVYPPRGLGADPLSGDWIITEDHSSIPGSIWLPEVGRGYLEDGHIAYFKHNLAQLSNQDPTSALLFYCTADCWQSWNAARRAALWGYRNVFWYPDGTDGWRDHGLPLTPLKPVNFLAR
jgi:PQQ-dependent catabolism-associated CXXCW motif protein